MKWGGIRGLSLDWNHYLEIDEVVDRISEKKKEKLRFLRDIKTQ